MIFTRFYQLRWHSYFMGQEILKQNSKDEVSKFLDHINHLLMNMLFNQKYWAQTLETINSFKLKVHISFISHRITISFQNKMWIFPSCSHISTTVELNHLLFEMPWWDLNKDAACYFQQILEASPYKTASVQPLASHYTNHPSKKIKTCWTLLVKKGQTHEQYTHIDSSTWTYQCWQSKKHLHSSDLWRPWKPFGQFVITNRDGWQKRVKGTCFVSTPK